MTYTGFLTVRLIADASIGSGESDALDVDLTVVTDRDGVPYVPRHRLVAALRQASASSHLAFPDDRRITPLLLAESRQIAGSALLTLADATVPPQAQQSIKDWQSQNEGRPTQAGEDAHAWRRAELLTHALTDVRVQTEIDDDGGPARGSLRVSRVVPAGFVFVAPFAIDGDDPELVATFARTCLALRELGGKVTRGFGQVEVLINGDATLTRGLAFGDADATPLRAGDEHRGGYAVTVARWGRSEHMTAVTVDYVLTTELKLSQADLLTPGTIPGSALRGVVNARVRGCADTHARLITSGKVAFGAGHLVAHDRSGELNALYPAPLNLRSDPESDELVDTLSRKHFPVIDLDRPPALLSRDRTLGGDVIGRVEQRVRTPEAVAGGTTSEPQPLYFENAVLERGQRFRFSFVVNGDNPDETQQIVAELFDALDRAPLMVGGGRSAYGGGLRRVTAPLPDAECVAELKVAEPDDTGGVTIDLVAATPVLSRDDVTGEFSPDAFATAALALFPGAVVLDTAIAPVLVGGRNARYTGVRPVHRAASAGSVVRLRLPHGVDASGVLHTRIGERTIDGFGEWYLANTADPAPVLAKRDQLVSPPPPSLLDVNVGCPDDWSEVVRRRLGGEAPSPDVPERAKPAEVSTAVESTVDVPLADATVVDIRFTLTLLTDTIIGAAAPLDAPMGEGNRLTLTRRPDTGAVPLRGTTLAGVLRHYAQLRLSDTEVRSLFGGADAGVHVKSSISFFDADFSTQADAGAERPWRTRVATRTDEATRAHEASFFATETLPAGTTVDCRVVGRLPKEGEGRVRWLTGLVATLDGFVGEDGPVSPGNIALGAYSRTGSGKARGANFRLRTFDLRTRDGFEQWFGASTQAPGPESSDTLAGILRSLGDSGDGVAQTVVKGLESVPRRHNRLDVTLSFKFEEPERLGIRDTAKVRPATLRHGSVHELDPPVTQGGQARIAEALKRRRVRAGGTTDDVWVDSGPSVMHALKHTALRIATEIAGRDKAALKRAHGVVADTFGSFKGDRPPRPSRIDINEPVIDGTNPVVLTRNRIDPLTQGVVGSDLFTGEVLAGGSSAVSLGLRLRGTNCSRDAGDVPDEVARGLLWAVLREYATGRGNAVGGGAGIGHGRRMLVGVEGTGVPSFDTWPKSRELSEDYAALVRHVRDGEQSEEKRQ